jgi:anti-sigma factor ChrR (cupin superfamily)
MLDLLNALATRMRSIAVLRLVTITAVVDIFILDDEVLVFARHNWRQGMEGKPLLLDTNEHEVLRVMNMSTGSSCEQHAHVSKIFIC